jgi:hypothetical protein
MSIALLGILKYFLLALVWLFFLRVVRAVWVEVRADRAVGRRPARVGPASPRPTGPAPNPASPPPGRSGADPTVVASRTAVSTQASHDRSGRLCLVITEPPERRGERFELERAGIVGRGRACEIPLVSDSFVSKRHARIALRADGFWIEDLGSTNGTWVNGERLHQPAALVPGTRVQVGQTVLEVEP